MTTDEAVATLGRLGGSDIGAAAAEAKDIVLAEVERLRFEVEKRGCWECPAKEERAREAETRLREVVEAAREMFDKLYAQTCGCPASHAWGEHRPTPPEVVRWRAAAQPEEKP